MEVAASHQHRSSTLSDAAKMYREAESNSGLQLEAIIHSVAAVLDLLSTAENTQDLAPLHHLFASLSRLASGHADKVLSPLREPGRSGKPKADGATLFKKVMIVHSAEILYRGHRGARDARKRADQMAADLANGLALTASHGKPISRHMIRNWRSECSGPYSGTFGEIVEEHCAEIKSDWPLAEAIAQATRVIRAAATRPGMEVSANPPLT